MRTHYIHIQIITLRRYKIRVHQNQSRLCIPEFEQEPKLPDYPTNAHLPPSHLISHQRFPNLPTRSTPTRTQHFKQSAQHRALSHPQRTNNSKHSRLIIHRHTPSRSPHILSTESESSQARETGGTSRRRGASAKEAHFKLAPYDEVREPARTCEYRALGARANKALRPSASLALSLRCVKLETRARESI